MLRFNSLVDLSIAEKEAPCQCTFDTKTPQSDISGRKPWKSYFSQNHFFRGSFFFSSVDNWTKRWTPSDRRNVPLHKFYYSFTLRLSRGIPYMHYTLSVRTEHKEFLWLGEFISGAVLCNFVIRMTTDSTKRLNVPKMGILWKLTCHFGKWKMCSVVFGILLVEQRALFAAGH